MRKSRWWRGLPQWSQLAGRIRGARAEITSMTEHGAGRDSARQEPRVPDPLALDVS